MENTTEWRKKIEEINTFATRDKKRALYRAYTQIARLLDRGEPFENEYFCELIYVALVHGNGALRREKNPEEALSLQKLVTDVALLGLPIGEDAKQTAEQAERWKESFPGKQMLPIALQELYFLLEISARFGDTAELTYYRSSLFHSLAEYYNAHQEDIWGDVFHTKQEKQPLPIRKQIVEDRQRQRKENAVMIPEAEQERQNHVKRWLHSSQLLWTLARTSISLLVSTKAIMKNKMEANDEIFAELYKKRTIALEQGKTQNLLW